MFARASPSSKREPEVGQLERDVDLQLLGGDPVEDLLVRVDDDAGLGLVVDPLPEQRRVGLEAVVVEPPQHDDRVVERLPRHEPGRAEAHPVPPHAALQPRAVGGGEDRLSQGGLDAGEGRHLGSGLYATATRRPVPNGRARDIGGSPGGRPPSCRKCDEVSTEAPGEPSRGARRRARSPSSHHVRRGQASRRQAGRQLSTARGRALPARQAPDVAAVGAHHVHLGPPRSARLRNAIRFPSGDQAGNASLAGLCGEPTLVLAVDVHHVDLAVAVDGGSRTRSGVRPATRPAAPPRPG